MAKKKQEAVTPDAVIPAASVPPSLKEDCAPQLAPYRFGQNPERDAANRELAQAARLEADRRRRMMKSALKDALSFTPDIAVGELAKTVSEMYRDNGMSNYAQAIAIAQVVKAAAGDTAAAIFVRDTIGEKPTDKVDQSGEITIRLAGVDPGWCG